MTNSSLDRETGGFAASRLIIRKELIDDTGRARSDTTFGNAGTPGKIVMTVGTTQICADTAGGRCTTLPASARPTATPTAILKTDGSGFLLLSLWYVPDANGCTKGKTYLAVHEVLAAGTVTQRQGLHVADEPVTSTVIAGGKLVVIDTVRGVTEVGTSLTTKFSSGTAVNPTTSQSAERYRQTIWQELP